jgi:Helix-turn-helix domain
MACSPVTQFISPTYKFIALFSAGIRAGQPVVPHDGTLAQLAQLRIFRFACNGTCLTTAMTAATESWPRNARLLSLPDTQDALGGIGLTMVYKLIDSGSIQRVKIGRRAFITQESIDAFIASLTAA